MPKLPSAKTTIQKARTAAKKLVPPVLAIKPDELDNIGRTRLTDEIFVKILQAFDTNPRRLKGLLAGLHGADVADIIERLPRQRRAEILPFIGKDALGDVIAELETGVQEHIIQLLDTEQIKAALSELDSDDAAELARVVEEVSSDENAEAADYLQDYQQKRLLQYDEGTAGGTMQLEVITALPTTSVSDILTHLRDEGAEIPEKPGTIFVV
ncbi:MAG: hypothetical protein COY40_05825, partial [Alphaproteobacteria bacterium CG_4_10_14_0_8_um_filter_53_9]